MRATYNEGDWFSVPLRSGGFAAGLVARKSRRERAILGYFFGPRRAIAPQLGDVLDLSPSSARLIARCGDLSLMRGEWEILGAAPDWDRARWPLPAFSSRDPLTGHYWKSEYDENELSKLLSRTRVGEQEASELPADGGFGAAAIAAVLDNELQKESDGSDAERL